MPPAKRSIAVRFRHRLPAPVTLQPAWRQRAACGGAALAAGLVYLNSLNNPFVYDDYHTVVANPSIHDLRDLRAIVLHDVTRPIVNFSYALDRALWGASPFGFHVTNVLLHTLNVALLFRLARKLEEDVAQGSARPVWAIGSSLVAFAAAVLFAVHPLMTEAVGYISGRSEVACAALFMLALMCGRRWMRGDGARWPILTIGLWCATLATKEVGAMFPFVLFCYDRCVLRAGDPLNARRLARVHLPFMGTAVLAGLVRVGVLVRVEYPGHASFHWSYVLIVLDVARRYVGLLLNPAHQAFFHEVTPIGVLDPRALVAVGAVAGVIALAWSVRRASAVASLGILWFLLLLVPSSVLVAFDQGEPMAEHRLYLANCGGMLAMGSLVGWVDARLTEASSAVRRLAGAALGLVLLSLAILTWSRNTVWADPVALWRESVDLAPTHFRPRLLLGEALQDANRLDEAVEQYRMAIRMRPSEPTGYIKLGQSLAQMGRLDEAAVAFEQLERLDPRSPIASSGMGTIAMLSGQPVHARRYFLETLERDPRNVPARQSLAVLAELDPANPDEALRLCEEIERLAPGTPGARECIARNRARPNAGVKP